ncbi:MAG TPA: hypothetical protein VHL34_24720 [Rhizomicrobium sp.]|jgi:hypothetical protein|nr:hypothetical protein [Rhizomicrobium sp.]
MRISTTTLESFRLFMQPDQEWMSADELAATIQGRFVPTPKVLLGKAFGEVLETPEAFKVSGGYRHGEYTFDDAVMEPALAIFDRRGVFEAKAVKQYGPYTVVAKADQLLGSQLIENKTTLSTFDFDKYAASCQWRFMADIFQPSHITYNVFCLNEDYNGYISLRGIETFNLYPYDGLHADCCALVKEFAEYAEVIGLGDFLRERQRLAEVA